MMEDFFGDYFGDSFENYNLLYDVATFEHFANHDPQPRKCSEIFNCDINKFMFICSQCDSEFENVDDYYIHQMLEHQVQKSQPETDLDITSNWYEKEFLGEFLEQPDATHQLKDFHESADKIIDMDEANAIAQKNNNFESTCDFFANNKPISTQPITPMQMSYSTDIHTTDLKQYKSSFEPSIPLIDRQRKPETLSHSCTMTHPANIQPTPERKRKKKRTPGQCDVCNRSFNDTYNLRIHKMIHTGEMPFQCEHCGKGFRQYNKLKIHSIIHTNKKPFVCDLCGKGFRFRNYLAIHKRLHTGEKPYKCKLCDEHFHSLHNRRLHVKSTHSDEEENFTCTICGKTLSTKCYLQVHMRRHNNQRDFKCEDCEKAFFTAAQLKEHIPSHAEEKPFQCAICQMTFLRKTNYNQHFKIHSNLKNYVCQICSKTFAQNAGLYAHMKLHQN